MRLKKLDKELEALASQRRFKNSKLVAAAWVMDNGDEFTADFIAYCLSYFGYYLDTGGKEPRLNERKNNE